MNSKNLQKKLNNMEKTIMFKEEIGGLEINFLDLNIKIKNNKFKIDIHRKETYADLIIPQESYHPMNTKWQRYTHSATELQIIWKIMN